MSAVGVRVLDFLATLWPSPVKARTERFAAVPGSADYSRAYAQDQFLRRVSRGLGLNIILPDIVGKDVLEIGCGHGGITCFIASCGVRRVVGVDVNEKNLEFGRGLAKEMSERTGITLPVEFESMDAHELRFEAGSFDLILADNLFEHVDDPARVFAECHRVLRKGGLLAVPTFCGIRSKYGLHLKHGIKMPWANLLFSEETIVKALELQAKRRPELYDVYPGLLEGPTRVRDVRRHRDLNGISHKTFLEQARAAGFQVREFTPFGTTLGRVLFRLAPRIAVTELGDILSVGAAAMLEKRDGR